MPLIAGNPQFKNVKCDRVETFLDAYFEEFIADGKGIFNPPYQRQADAWGDRYKQAFMCSIANHMYLPPMHFCQPDQGEGDTRLTCMDGVQRDSAIRSFFNNEFSIPVFMTNGRRPRPMRWEDFKTSKVLAPLRRYILKAKINYMLWNHMVIDDQLALFSMINHSVSLSPDERLYCHNYLSRCLLRQVFGTCLGELKSHFAAYKADGSRYRDIRVAHEVMLLSSGPSFTEAPAARSINSEVIKSSAPVLETRLKGLGFKYGDDMNETDTRTDSAVIDDLGWADQMNLIRLYADALCNVLNTEENIDISQDGHRNQIDPLGFLLMLHHDERYDFDSFSEETEEWVAVLKHFYALKRHLDLNRCTTDGKTMVAKYHVLELLFEQRHDLNPSPSDHEIIKLVKPVGKSIKDNVTVSRVAKGVDLIDG